MKKETLKPLGIMPPGSYYAPVVRAGNFLFLAGIPGVDIENRKIIKSFDDIPDEDCRKLATGDFHMDVLEEPIMAQTWWVYMQMKKILESQGSSLENILQATVYLKHIRKHFVPFNRVRKMFIKDPPPSTVLEARLGASDDVLVEVTVIALIPDEK